jgi:CBS domain-containing protein
MNNIKVKDLMTTLVVSFDPKEPIHEAAGRLANNGVSGGPVLDGGKVVGVISEADLILASTPPAHVDRGVSVFDVLTIAGSAKPRHHEHGKTVGDVMSLVVVDIGPEESIWSAARRMEVKAVKRLPVVDEDGNLLGIISRADLVGALARRDSDIAEDVADAIQDLGVETVADLDIRSNNGVVTLVGRVDRRTTAEIAVRLASRVMGVIEVLDRLRYDWDDTHLKPRAVVRSPWAEGSLVRGR